MSTKPPSGTRDFLPADVRRREHVIGVVRRVYERYGFEPLETPAFENIETLIGKYGEEGNKLIFKILKRGEHEASGEADLALRYDLTVPLARVVAQYQNELPKFFKRYQIQPVWRADRPAKGRFREFYQCDIDSIGSTSPVVEAEQLSAVTEVLTTLGFRRLHDPAESSRAADGDARGRERARRPARRGAGGDRQAGQDRPRRRAGRNWSDGASTDESASACLDAFEDVPAFERLVQASEQGRRRQVRGRSRFLLSPLGTPAAGHVSFVPRLARGLSYYTGAIMEITVPDLAGSLGGGGRYDNLVGMFLGRDVPACGFSLGLERIIVVMTERGMFPDSIAGGGVDVMVTVWNDDSRSDALALAGELRRGGLRVDVYPEADKLGKQFKYASSRAVPFVAIVGDDERANGTVSVKDLRSGAQETMPRARSRRHSSPPA